MADVRDNKALGRFELDVEGALAFANYRLTPAGRHHHAYGDAAGIARARRRFRAAQGFARPYRGDGRKVIAGCGFVVDYLYKHPEYADLMA